MRTNSKGWKRFLIVGTSMFFGTLAAVAIFFFAYVGVVTQRIDQRIEQLKSNRASQFFAIYPPIKKDQHYQLNDIKAYLTDQGYREKKDPEDLAPGEYAVAIQNEKMVLDLYRPPFEGAGNPVSRLKARVSFEKVENDFLVKEILRLDNHDTVESLESIPQRVASYFAGRLRTQDSVRLSDMPASLRLAVMAIEDVNFLDHGAVSIRGTLRALYNDIKARKFVEGGSTLTQQLMKNLFFSREKSILRKVKEAIFAYVTESRHSKEEILEAYLNEVYMGQWSTREIHGVSEGARFYFNRTISQISLSQSATLAAIVQAPNAMDPNRSPERTLKRRNLVLKQMLNAQFISNEEYDSAVTEPLGVTPSERNMADADYALDLVMERLSESVKSRLDTDALTVYVTLNPYLQAVASRAITENVERLRNGFPKLQAKEKRGYHVQSALIAVDVKNCSVIALQGGRSYRQTQFNRVVHGMRQPGSLFKPFVYLTGFLQATPEKPFTAMTELEDSPFEWKYDKQLWKPKNYDNLFRGKVTVEQALSESLNVPTARLTEQVGVEPIRQTLIKAGIVANVPAVPSISLGSAEVTPLELAEAFTTVANLGQHCNLIPFTQVYDPNKNLVEEKKPKFEEALPALPTFETIQLMKAVITKGTARSVVSSGLFFENLAGKTGTTNDAKDAWFIGFTPEILALVWVGFDEEEKIGLTGSVAALPLWIEFMRKAKPFLTNIDFVSPANVPPPTH